MIMWHPENYQIGMHLFFQLLGLIYFFAIGAFLPQIQGLLGKEGILPIPTFLKAVFRQLGKKSYYLLPSLFWFKSSDAMLVGTVVVGMVCSLLLFAGICIPLMLLILYVIYLSIVSAGQNFLSFGWEMFLLEITFNAFFLSIAPGNIALWISMNLLLVRFHVQAGAVKLQSKDKTWHDLTALSYHYQTQPIPNTIAWYVHKWPMWFHKFSAGMMFFIELIVPIGILLGDEWIRLVCFGFLAGLQFMIWITGNFSYLNHMTTVFCLILISDSFLGLLFSTHPAPVTSPGLQIFGTVIGCILIFLQGLNVWHHLVRPSNLWGKVSDWIAPFHIVNRYGIFAVMTVKRFEIVVEGSMDGIHWEEYLFKHKPSEVSRRPRRISPYQPRLDWQIWFLPFSNFQRETWFRNFLYCLLMGFPSVLKLLRKNPFPDQPPKYVRALVYDYVFSSKAVKRETGDWWQRTLVANYSSVQSLTR